MLRSDSFVLLHFISNLQRYPFCLQTQMDYSVTFPDDLCMLCSPAGPWESPPSPCLHTATPRACLTSRLVPRRIVQGCRIGRVRESSASGSANYFLMWRRFFWRACFLADQIPLKGPWGVQRAPGGSALWQGTPGPEGGLMLHPACRDASSVGRPGSSAAPSSSSSSFLWALKPPRQAAAEPCRNSDTRGCTPCRKP